MSKWSDGQWEKKRQQLISLAKRFQETSDGELISVRHAAKSLRIRQDDVIEMTEASDGLDLIVGMRVGGLGGGVYEHESKGDYQIEWFQEERS